MQPVELTDDVWTALLALKKGHSASVPHHWTAAEKAAFSLYAPLAGQSSEGTVFFAQVGQSLDGRVATEAGDAQDISGDEGLAHLHRCRAMADGVMVGVCTAIHDNPRLTVRLARGESPARIVIDPDGRMPDEAKLLAGDGGRRLVVQACDRARPRGVEVVRIKRRGDRIDPRDIRDGLSERGLKRVLVEGGAVTISHFLEAGLLHRLHVAVAPLIIGAGPSGLRTNPVAKLADALRPETHIYGFRREVVFDCVLARIAPARNLAFSPASEAAMAKQLRSLG